MECYKHDIRVSSFSSSFSYLLLLLLWPFLVFNFHSPLLHARAPILFPSLRKIHIYTRVFDSFSRRFSSSHYTFDRTFIIKRARVERDLYWLAKNHRIYERNLTTYSIYMYIRYWNYFTIFLSFCFSIFPPYLLPIPGL